MRTIRRPLSVLVSVCVAAAVLAVVPTIVQPPLPAGAMPAEPTGVIAYTVSTPDDSSRYGAEPEVWLVERDGSDRRKVDDGVAIGWSPSGRWLLVGKEHSSVRGEFLAVGLVAADGTKRSGLEVACDPTNPLYDAAYQTHSLPIAWGPGDTLAHRPCHGEVDYPGPVLDDPPHLLSWAALRWYTLDGIMVRQATYVAPEPDPACGGPWSLSAHSLRDEPSALVVLTADTCQRAYLAPGPGSWNLLGDPYLLTSTDDFDYLTRESGGTTFLEHRSGGTPIPIDAPTDWFVTDECQVVATGSPLDTVAPGAEVLAGMGRIEGIQSQFGVCPDPPVGGGSGVLLWQNDGTVPVLVAQDPAPDRRAGTTIAIQCRADQCATQLSAIVLADGLDVLDDTEFSFTGSLTGSVGPGEALTDKVGAGPHSLTLGAIDGITVNAISCGGAGTADLSTRSISLSLTWGDNVLCTFTVSRDGLPNDSDGDGIPDGLDPCPDDPTNSCDTGGGDGGDGGGGGGETQGCRQEGADIHVTSSTVSAKLKAPGPDLDLWKVTGLIRWCTVDGRVFVDGNVTSFDDIDDLDEWLRDLFGNFGFSLRYTADEESPEVSGAGGPGVGLTVRGRLDSCFNPTALVELLGPAGVKLIGKAAAPVVKKLSAEFMKRSKRGVPFDEALSTLRSDAVRELTRAMEKVEEGIAKALKAIPNKTLRDRIVREIERAAEFWEGGVAGVVDQWITPYFNPLRTEFEAKTLKQDLLAGVETRVIAAIVGLVDMIPQLCLKLWEPELSFSLNAGGSATLVPSERFRSPFLLIEADPLDTTI